MCLIYTWVQYTVFHTTRCCYKQFRDELEGYQVHIVEGFLKNNTFRVISFILEHSIMHFIILDAVISNLDTNQEPIRLLQQKVSGGMIHLKIISFILDNSILYFVILDAVISFLDMNQKPIRCVQQKTSGGIIHLKSISFILGGGDNAFEVFSCNIHRLQPQLLSRETSINMRREKLKLHRTFYRGFYGIAHYCTQANIYLPKY